MKVNRKAGSCSSWQEMDIESRQAVYLAERLVENKRGVKIGNERHNNCTLDIHYGSNIYLQYTNRHHKQRRSGGGIFLQRLFLRHYRKESSGTILRQ